MTDDLDKAAGSGVTVTLGGKEYDFKPFLIDDYLQLRKHMRSRRLSELMGNPEFKNLDSDTKAKAIADLMNMSITEDEVWKESLSREGFVFMLWSQIHRQDPKMTLEDVQGEMTSEIWFVYSIILSKLNTPAEAVKKSPLASGSGGTISSAS